MVLRRGLARKGLDLAGAEQESVEKTVGNGAVKGALVRRLVGSSGWALGQGRPQQDRALDNDSSCLLL